MRTKLRGKFTLLFMTFALLLAIPAIALADIVVADGDTVTAGAQGSRALGTVQPGATVTPAVDFYLKCDTKQHFNSDDTANINFTGGTIKDANNNTVGSANATSLTGLKGPQNNWPADAVDCPTGISDRLLGSSTATIVAPKKAGTYTVQLDYAVEQLRTATGETTNQELKNGIQNDPLTFTMTVPNAAPVINSFNGDATATEGQTKTYSINATDANEDSLTYGLQKSSTGGANVTITAGATAGSFNVKFDTAGSVDLRASASDGTNTTTQTRTVTVASACTIPSVTTQPTNQTVTYGNNATFSAAASGTSPGVQWQANDGTGWSNIAGANSATLTVSNPAVADSGKQYRAVFSNGCGSATSNAATLTVEKATAGVQLSNLGPHTYDGTAKSASATTSNPSGLNVGITYNGSSTAPTDAGTYNVVATVNEANYRGSANGTLVIGRATPQITWSNPAPIEYGTALSGVQLNAQANVAGSFSYTPASGTKLDAGADQQLKADFTPSNTGNYNEASKTVLITVNKAAQAIDFGALENKTFGDPKFRVSAQGGDSGNPVAFAASGQCTIDANNDVTITGAGSCTITASQAGNANYFAADSVSRRFDIARADATIVVRGFDGTYDGQPHGATTATATGVKGENLGSLLRVSGSFTNFPGGQGSWTFDGNTNYKEASGTFEVKIAKAPSATTVTCPGGPFTYTGTAQTPCTVSVTGAGGLNLSPAANYSDNTNAGTATASYSYAGGDNHLGSGDSATFTIGKAQLLIDARNQSTVYGDSHLAPSYDLSGFVNDENANTAGVTGKANCLIGTAGPGVGEYRDAITCAPGDLRANNYSFAAGTKGNLTITARPITVTADAQSKTYGDADPALTYQVGGSGLAPGESKAGVFSGSLTRAVGENVGSYAIRQGSLAANSNYNLTSYTGANFTITARATAVTAVSQTKQIGTADPALTYQATNLAPGDTLGSVFSGSLTRDPGEGIGTYAIRQGSLAANSNYNLSTFNNGTLKIVYGTAFGGIQQPINADGSSRVKLGSTIPVKFTLSSNGSPLNSAVAYLNVKKLDNTPDLGVDEALLTVAASSGNQFRLGDATTGQYIYNLSTKNAFTGANGSSISTWSQGTYQLQIVLDDGTARTVNIQIVK